MNKHSHLTLSESAHAQIFPSLTSYNEVNHYLAQNPDTWSVFLDLPYKIQQELLDFYTGKQGLRVTYDSIFQKLFRPDIHKKRLESLLSALLNRNVKIISVIPREGTQLVEQGSFVIMDVLVQLDDGSYANIEMQKVGYSFPLARADCYASDIIMRQYVKEKAHSKNQFSFQSLNKVYCVILMERSPAPFHTIPNKYVHRRYSCFDTGIFPNDAGLHEDIFICLDSFNKIPHTITKDSSLQEAWLTFLCCTDVPSILSLISIFPFFAELYQELTDFTRQPEELINMLSKELYIMDRNMEKLMIAEWQEEMEATKAALDSAQNELNSTQNELNSAQQACKVYKLLLQEKSKEEIASILDIPLPEIEALLSDLI